MLFIVITIHVITSLKLGTDEIGEVDSIRRASLRTHLLSGSVELLQEFLVIHTDALVFIHNIVITILIEDIFLMLVNIFPLFIGVFLLFATLEC